jgi:hypothetical protein
VTQNVIANSGTDHEFIDRLDGVAKQGAIEGRT